MAARVYAGQTTDGAPGRRAALPSRRWPRSTSRPAWRTSSSSATRSSCTTPWPAIESDPRRAGAFERIAANERRHADIWASKLTELGVDGARRPGDRGPGSGSSSWSRGCSGRKAVTRPRQGARGRRGGGLRRPGIVARGRGDRRRRTRARPHLGPSSASDDATGRGDRGVGRQSRRGGHRATGDARRPRSVPSRHGIGPAGAPARSGPSSSVSATAWSATSPSSWASPGAATQNPSFIFLAGIAGLLAGSFSMAAGEYISMQSQRELFERQIALERAEMAAMPEEEEAELAAAYRAKGFSDGGGDARRPSHLPRPRRGARHARPRGARPGSRSARIADPGGVRVVPRLRGRCGRARHPVPVRWRHRGDCSSVSGSASVALFAVGAAVSLLTGREHALLRHATARHRARRGARDLRHRQRHRRGDGGVGRR